MKISDAESIVMEALWAKSPLTAEDVCARVADAQDWRKVTVKTLLNRLLNKGAVTVERQGRKYLYSPALTRDAYVSAQSKSLLDRLFEGRIAPLVTHFSEREELSREDIAELKRLIAELDDDA